MDFSIAVHSFHSYADLPGQKEKDDETSFSQFTNTNHFGERQSEMTFGESVSAPGFQIDFEGSRPLFQLKGNIGFQFPRPVFRRMWNASGIVCGETLAQVACAADVTLIRMTDAAQNVSVKHQFKPVVYVLNRGEQ